MCVLPVSVRQNATRSGQISSKNSAKSTRVPVHACTPPPTAATLTVACPTHLPARSGSKGSRLLLDLPRRRGEDLTKRLYGGVLADRRALAGPDDRQPP